MPVEGDEFGSGAKPGEGTVIPLVGSGMTEPAGIKLGRKFRGRSVEEMQDVIASVVDSVTPF